MTDETLRDIITLRDDISEITPSKVRYRELARWTRVLSQIIVEEVENAPATSA